MRLIILLPFVLAVSCSVEARWLDSVFDTPIFPEQFDIDRFAGHNEFHRGDFESFLVSVANSFNWLLGAVTEIFHTIENRPGAVSVITISTFECNTTGTNSTKSTDLTNSTHNTQGTPDNSSGVTSSQGIVIEPPKIEEEDEEVDDNDDYLDLGNEVEDLEYNPLPEFPDNIV